MILTYVDLTKKNNCFYELFTRIINSYMYFLLRIISNFRGIKTEDQEESERLFKLVDVIKDDKEVDAKTKNTEKLDTTEPADQITCNGVPLVKLAEEEYVYDVYTMQSDAMSSTGIIKVDLFWEGRKNMNNFEDIRTISF